MIQHLYIGPCPSDEYCAQIGLTEGSRRLNRIECEAYIEALRKVYGPEPEGAYLNPKTEHHDFGSYLEVVVYYDDNEPEAVQYAFKIEMGLRTWSEADMEPPVRYDNKNQAILGAEELADGGAI